MAGLHQQERLVEDLRSEFRIKWGGTDAEFRMAEELIALNTLLLQYEAKICELEKDRHLAFYRDPPRSGG